MDFKKDKFRKSRGSYSRWLEIFCESCKKHILFYQKDGPGILKRLYIDQIVETRHNLAKNLVCKKCKSILGVSNIYKKEKRLVYRLFVGAVNKKIIKLDHLLK